MMSLKYRKAAYQCFADSHTKAIFESMIYGITRVLIHDTDDTTDIEDIFAFRDEHMKFFDEPKKPEGAEQ